MLGIGRGRGMSKEIQQRTGKRESWCDEEKGGKNMVSKQRDMRKKGIRRRSEENR